MIRVLVMIAVAGFLAGVVALAGAAALGGPDLAARNWNWAVDWHDRDEWGEREWRDRDLRRDRPADKDAGEITRELAWDGSTKAEFDIPAAVEFTQAPGPGKVTIYGPKAVVDAIRLSDGRLSLDQPVADHARLRVVMTAPAVTRFQISGDDRLEIRSYKQDQLAIIASGSSEVVASGQAREVDVELSGTGEADLTDLVTDNAEADISGSAKVVLAPREAANLEVSGSATARLLTRPKRLETDVAGAGSVIFEDGGKAGGVGTPAKPAKPAGPTET
ncbi:MAG: GIN domain-containing protein [Phenylobacterium sp.]